MYEIIRHSGDKDHDKTFCVFAVRVNRDVSTGQRKLMAGVPYYLMKGFDVEGDTIRIERYADTLLRDSIFNQSYQNQTSRAHLNFSAIVGMNGSGKSTLVEYILRLINNCSASVFGEYKKNAATDRLHFIDGVDGELFYYSQGLPFSLRVKNDSVKLFHYKSIGPSSDGKAFLFEKDATFYNNHRGGVNEKCHSPFEESSSDDIKHLFYTLVVNHSIYAYNANDFENECCGEMEERRFDNAYYERNKIEKPKGIESKEYSLEERCWLHGLFHKNDGYQIPLVLNPFRKNGCIDINNENKLAKERLVSLLVSPGSEFRKINGHLEVVSLTLKRNGDLYDRHYTNVKLDANIPTDEVYDSIKNLIFDSWLGVLNKDDSFGKGKRYYEDTRSYVCYKTLKIAKQYRQYQYFFDSFKKKEWNVGNYDVQQLIDRISLDSSHITGKLFQALNYLIYDIYSDEAIKQPMPLDSIRIHKPAGTNSQPPEYPQTFLSAKKVRLIPSPIFDVTINLQDSRDNRSVDFETLSSGERQLTYAVSSLLYHLNNIDSVAQDNNGMRIIYKKVNIILEEVELYFHPELQKQLVKYMIDGIGQLNFHSIQGINVILVTHSPFILSDIPSTNILALTKDGMVSDEIRSFGSNIHDMLKDSFFLQTGWIGDFAQDHISRIIKQLEEEQLDAEKREQLHRKIMLIDEPVIRTLLLDKFRVIYPDTKVDQRIAELTKELNELKEGRPDVEAQ